jgi:hypothetical protein
MKRFQIGKSIRQAGGYEAFIPDPFPPNAEILSM